MNFRNKTVLITGASSGIGMALAREFASLGANIVMGARGEDKLAELAAELATKGVETVYRRTDVSSQDDCKALVEAGVEKFGGIDVCICNAGISMRALYDDVDMSVIHRLMDVNFWGTAYTVKYALPYMSSVARFHGLPGPTGYSASKYAMQGLLETIRIENLKKGVHVMIAAPGFTASNVRFSALTADGSPQGASPRQEDKMMTAEEAAHRIIRGVARRKREVVMDFNGKATKFIKKFCPSLLDILFYNHMAKEPDSPFK